MLKLTSRDHLAQLIADREQESLTLEFKAGDALGKDDAKRADISKDVSAMANAAGGQIIYGIRERKTRAAAFAPVDRRQINQEWLENVIRHHIRPAIEGLHILQVEVGPGEHDVAYVLTIQQAVALAPHQANDDRYYRRFNFQACPMADYEIRDAMRRKVDPDLHVQIGYRADDAAVRHFRLLMSPTIFNSSSEPALYSALTLFADRRLSFLYDAGSPFASDALAPNDHPRGFKMHAQTATFAPPAHFPIFRERPFETWRCPWEIRTDAWDCELGVGYRISAPGCFREEFGTIRIEKDRLTVVRVDRMSEPGADR